MLAGCGTRCPGHPPARPQADAPSLPLLETRWRLLGDPVAPQSWAAPWAPVSPCRPLCASVANRGSLVPAPTEPPCSLHTKNGNPQAVLGAGPSWPVATAPAPTRLLRPAWLTLGQAQDSRQTARPRLEGAHLGPGEALPTVRLAARSWGAGPCGQGAGQ